MQILGTNQKHTCWCEYSSAQAQFEHLSTGYKQRHTCVYVCIYVHCWQAHSTRLIMTGNLASDMSSIFCLIFNEFLNTWVLESALPSQFLHNITDLIGCTRNTWELSTQYSFAVESKLLTWCCCVTWEPAQALVNLQVLALNHNTITNVNAYVGALSNLQQLLLRCVCVWMPFQHDVGSSCITIFYSLWHLASPERAHLCSTVWWYFLA